MLCRLRIKVLSRASFNVGMKLLKAGRDVEKE